MIKCLSLLLSFSLILSSVTPSLAQINRPSSQLPRTQIPLNQNKWERDGVQQTVALDEQRAQMQRSLYEAQFTKVENKQVPVLEEMNDLLRKMEQVSKDAQNEEKPEEKEEPLSLDEFEKEYRAANEPVLKQALQQARTPAEKELYKKAFDQLIEDTWATAYQSYLTEYGKLQAKQEAQRAQQEREFMDRLRKLCDRAATITQFIGKGYRTFELSVSDKIPGRLTGSVDPISAFLPAMYQAFGEKAVTPSTREKAVQVLRQRVEQLNGNTGSQALLQNAHALAIMGTQEQDAHLVANVLKNHFNEPGSAPVFISTLGADLLAMKDVDPHYRALSSFLLTAQRKEVTDVSVWDVTPLKLENWVKAVHELADGGEFATPTYIHSFYKDDTPEPSCGNKPCENHQSAWIDFGREMASVSQKDANLKSMLDEVLEQLVVFRRGKDGMPQLITHNNLLLTGLLSWGFQLNLKGSYAHQAFTMNGVENIGETRTEVAAAIAQIKALGLTTSEYVAFILYHHGYMDINPITARYIRNALTQAVAEHKREPMGMHTVLHETAEEVENFEMWQRVQSNFAFADKVLAFVAEFVVFWVLTDGILAAASSVMRFGTSFVRAVRLSTVLSREAKGSFSAVKLARLVKIAQRVSSVEKVSLQVGKTFVTSAQASGKVEKISVSVKSVAQRAKAISGKNIFTHDGITYLVTKGFKNVLVRVNGRVQVEVVKETLTPAQIAKQLGVAAEDVLEITVKDGRAVGKALDWLKGTADASRAELNYTSGAAGVHTGSVSAGVGAGAGVTEGITPLTLQAPRVLQTQGTSLVTGTSAAEASATAAKTSLQSGSWWQRSVEWLDKTVFHWRPQNTANPGWARSAWDRMNFALRIEIPDFFSNLGRLTTSRYGVGTVVSSMAPSYASAGLNANAGVALVAEANMARNAVTVTEMASDWALATSAEALPGATASAVGAQGTPFWSTMGEALTMGLRGGTSGTLAFNLSPWWAPENQLQTPLQVGIGKSYQNWWSSRQKYLTARTKFALPQLEWNKPVHALSATATMLQAQGKEDAPATPALQAAEVVPANSAEQAQATVVPAQKTQWWKKINGSSVAAAAAAAVIVGGMATGNPTVALAGVFPFGIAVSSAKKQAAAGNETGKTEDEVTSHGEGDQTTYISGPMNKRQQLLVNLAPFVHPKLLTAKWFKRFTRHKEDAYHYSYVDVVYNTNTKKARPADGTPLQEGEQQFTVAEGFGFIAPQVIPERDEQAIIKEVTAQKEAEAAENETTVKKYELEQAIEKAKSKHIFSIMTRQADLVAGYIMSNEFAERSHYVWILASAASAEMKIKAFNTVKEKGWKRISVTEVLAERSRMAQLNQLEIKINADGASKKSAFNLEQKTVDAIVAKVNARAQVENKGQLVPQTDPILSQGLTDRELTSIDASLLTESLMPAEGMDELLRSSTHETNGGNTVYEKVVPVYLRDDSGKETDEPRLYLKLNKPFIMPRGFHLVLDESGHFKVSIANLREVERTSPWRQPYNRFWKWLYKAQPDFLDKLPWVVNNPKRLRDWDSQARKRVFETPLKASELTALNYILSQRKDQVAVLPTAEADQFESVMNLVAIVAGADLGASLSSQMKKTIFLLSLVLLLTGFGYISPRLANKFKGLINKHGSYRAFRAGFATMFGLSLAGMLVPGSIAAAGAPDWLSGLQAFFQGGMFGAFQLGSATNLIFASVWMMAAIITASVFSTLAGPTLKSGYPDNTVFASKNMGFTTMKGLSRFGVSFLASLVLKAVLSLTGVDLNWSVLVPVMGIMSFVGFNKLKHSRLYTEHRAQRAEQERAAADEFEGKTKKERKALQKAKRKAQRKEDSQKKITSEQKYKALFEKPLSTITKRLGLIYVSYAFVNSVVIGSLGGMLYSSPTALALTGAGLFLSWLVRKGADRLIKSRTITEDQLTGISLPLMAGGVLGSFIAPFGSLAMLLSWLAMFLATPTFGVSENTRMMNHVAAYYKTERAKVNKDASLTEAEKEKKIKALNEEEKGQKLNASAAYNKYNAWGVYGVYVGIAMALFRDLGMIDPQTVTESLRGLANAIGIHGTGMSEGVQHIFQGLHSASQYVTSFLQQAAEALRLGGSDSPIFIKDGWDQAKIAAEQAKAPTDFAIYRLGMLLPTITSALLLLKNKGMIKEGVNRIISSVILTQKDIEKGEDIPKKLHIDFEDVGSLTAEVSKEVDDLSTAIGAFVNSRTSEERLQGWANRMVWVNNRLKALTDRSPLLSAKLAGELLRMKELSEVFYKILEYNAVSDALQEQGMQIKESFDGVSKVGRSTKVTLGEQFVYLPEIKLSFWDQLKQWWYRLTGLGSDPAQQVFSGSKADHYELALMNMREMNTMLKEAEAGIITDRMFSTFQRLYNDAVDHLGKYNKQNAALGRTEADSRIQVRKDELDELYRQFMNQEPKGVVEGLQP